MPANPSFDDVVTTTLRNRSKTLADNATRTTALLDRLRRKKKINLAAGGRSIVQSLEVALNPNGSWYAGLDTLNTNLHEPLSAAEYDWKQAVVSAVWSGLDKLKNMGEYEVIDLITSRANNAEKSLIELVSVGVYSDGTAFGGKQIGGLGLMVVASPATGTVGGIDRAGNTFWRNQTATVAMSTASNLVTANPPAFLTALNGLAIACTRGTDSPDLYIADAIGYNRYLESVQPIQRVTNMDMAGYGFANLQYAGMGGVADFVLDNGTGTPTKTVYALNTDYLYLRPHPDRNFVAFGGDRVPVNQDAVVRFMGFTGNLCASNLFLQGVMTSSN